MSSGLRRSGKIIAMIAGIQSFLLMSGISQNEKAAATIGNIVSLYTRSLGNNLSEEQEAIDKSKSGNSYNFMKLRKTIGAINEMILATGDLYWINQQVRIINNLIQTAQTSSSIPGNQTFRDEFKSWVSLNPNKNFNREVPLYESYSFLYITQFLYLIKQTDWFQQNDSNAVWWKNTLSFVEKNIWNKWYERSVRIYHNPYRYFLRSRTHMGSHFAGIALYLHALTNNGTIKTQTDTLIQQYDTLLKRNLKPANGGYLWNATYDNVNGTFAAPASSPDIQDVSHGNHVVSYLTIACSMGDKTWTPDDMKRLGTTLKEIIYNNKNGTFHDNVDGTDDPKRPGWGNFIADGWLKLVTYDDELISIFKKFEQTDKLERYNQEFLFKATLFNREHKKQTINNINNI